MLFEYRCLQKIVLNSQDSHQMKIATSQYHDFVNISVIILGYKLDSRRFGIGGWEQVYKCCIFLNQNQYCQTMTKNFKWKHLNGY